MPTKRKPARRRTVVAKPRKRKARRKARTPAQIAKALKFSTITFPQYKRLSIVNKVRFIRWNDLQGEWGFLSSPSNRDHATLNRVAEGMF